MKKKNVLFNKILYVVLGMAIVTGIAVVVSFLSPVHKDCAKTSLWDGKSILGEPAVVMVAWNYHSRLRFSQSKRTSDPRIIQTLSQELYGNRKGNRSVPDSSYKIIYMSPNGSQIIVPVFFDRKNKEVISLNTKSHELWVILNSIPRVENLSLQNMMERFPKREASRGPKEGEFKPHAPRIPKEE